MALGWEHQVDTTWHTAALKREPEGTCPYLPHLHFHPTLYSAVMWRHSSLHLGQLHSPHTQQSRKNALLPSLRFPVPTHDTVVLHSFSFQSTTFLLLVFADAMLTALTVACPLTRDTKCLTTEGRVKVTVMVTYVTPCEKFGSSIPLPNNKLWSPHTGRERKMCSRLCMYLCLKIFPFHTSQQRPSVWIKGSLIYFKRSSMCLNKS